MLRFGQLVCGAAILAGSLASQCYCQDRSNAITISSLARHEKLIGLTSWTAGRLDMLCVFSQEQPASKDALKAVPMRTMTVYRQDKVGLTKIFETKTADWFVSAYPTREDGRLLVIWGAGSAYHILAYAYEGDHIQQVLDERSREMPEMVYDGSGRESILLTSPAMVNGAWENSSGKTTILRWTGTSYDQAGTVPWIQRFQIAFTDTISKPN